MYHTEDTQYSNVKTPSAKYDFTAVFLREAKWPSTSSGSVAIAHHVA